MAKRSRPAAKSQSRKSKAGLKRLADLGLYRGDTSRVSDYGARQLRRFADVLKGEASAVKVPTRQQARQFQNFKTKYRIVVIPRQKGERLFYNKKSGDVFSYRKQYGHTIKRIIPALPVRSDTVVHLRKGQKIRYAIPIGGPGHYERFDNFDDLAHFMSRYEETRIVTDKHGVRPVSYKDWRKYVEIEVIDPDETDVEE